VDADVQQAIALGIHATPTLLVSGRMIVGVPSVEDFRALLDEALRGRR
jgi:protein-disulfide isomerase